MNAVVELKGVSKSYGGPIVVNNIDLIVNKGECFGLLGPNGAGKSTTLRMLLGNTPPDSGSIQVLGYSIPKQSRQMRRRVGVVPQQDNLDPDFTVTENLRTYASYFAIKGAQLESRINELLAFAALEERRNASINALSGGMQRRLTLARALINEPDLIVLDEPTTGLDPQARHLIWQWLRNLMAQGKTVILTTHYMEEAQRLCDRVAIMNNGKILIQGSPSELVERFIEPQVFEVYGTGLNDWSSQLEFKPELRTERVGETVFCYCNEENNLIDELRDKKSLRYIRRPANLEDVFLKLTGRELRE